MNEIKEAAESMAEDLSYDTICFARIKALMDITVLGIIAFSGFGIMLIMDLVFIAWYSIGITVIAIAIILAVGYHFLKKDYIINFEEEMIDVMLKIEDTL